MKKQLLLGYDSESNAYLVDDYPYGFRLRTKIRYWVESVKGKGDRFCSQTLNPKTGRWNKPKKSTYAAVMAMYLNEDDHVKYTKGARAMSTVEKVTDAFNKLEASVRKAMGQKLCDYCGHQEATRSYSVRYWFNLGGEAEKDWDTYEVCQECYDKYHKRDKARER